VKYSEKIENNTMSILFDGDLIGGGDSLDLMDKINERINEGVLKCIIDLKEVRYMNSSGIGIIITIYTKFKNRGGDAFLSNPSDQIFKLMKLTKLDSVIKVI
jgi:anti-sigma B factor antagonist